MNYLLALPLLLLSVSAFAQNSETRSLQSFDRLIVDYGIEATILHGDNYQVVLTGDDEVLEHVQAISSGGQLKLTFEQGIGNTFSGLFRDRKVKAVVTMPKLTAVIANGGATVVSKASWQAEQIELVSNGGADITLSIAADQLDIMSNGGSEVMVSGRVDKATLRANGGSTINAKQLTATHVNANANGAADITINATESLNARANGGSDIYYSGAAKLLTVKSSGGSEITKL